MRAVGRLLLVAVVLTVARCCRAQAPNGGTPFDMPPCANQAYATDAVYRQFYDIAGNNTLLVASPVPSTDACDYVSTPADAQAAFDAAVLNQTDVAAVVATFFQVRRHQVQGFDAQAFISYFTPTPTPTPTGNGTVPPPTSGTSTAPSAMPEADAVKYLELAIMRHVNVRDQFRAQTPQCFTTTTLAPGEAPRTDSPTAAREFVAQIVDPSIFTPDTFRLALIQFFTTVGPVPSFDVQPSGSASVVVTILSQGDAGAIAAVALLRMTVAEQTNLGIANLTPQSDVPAPPHAGKKFPLWIVAAIVGGLVLLLVVVLVISRRSPKHAEAAGSAINERQSLVNQV